MSRIKAYSLALTFFLLTGCGFSPLYAQKQAQAPETAYQRLYGEKPPVATFQVTDETAKIYVAPIADRLGQLIRNRLSERLAPRGQANKLRYRLKVDLEKPVHQQGVRIDDTATRATVTFKADYRLFEGDTVVVSGKTRTIGSYNILDAPYGTVVSAQKTEERAADVLANDIALRLAVFFTNKATK